MMYVELIERDRSMPIEVFRQLGNQATSWAEGAIDRMVLQIGRTLRLGSRPAYLCFWEIPDIGRLDAWEDHFESLAAKTNARSQAMHRAINIDRGGLYDVLHAGAAAKPRLYVVEHMDPGTLPPQQIALAFKERAAGLPRTQPLYVLNRIGHCGPEPAVLAVWAAASYVDLEPLLRTPSPRGLKLVEQGVYKDFGRETL